MFEFDQFAEGTKTLAMAIADSKAFSIAGGGDTLAAIAKYNIADKIGYISTGGGAFLEFLEGKTLPAVEILQQRERLEHRALHSAGSRPRQPATVPGRRVPLNPGRHTDAQSHQDRRHHRPRIQRFRHPRHA